MKTYKTALLATAATFALGMGVAMAEDVPGATNDIVIAAEEANPGSAVEPNTEIENKGALSAPEKKESQSMEGAGSTTGGMTDESSANVPGASAEGNPANENQGALSAPEKDTMGTDKPTGGMTDRSAGNVPGADAEGDPDSQNQGALSAPEKDTDKM